MVLTPEQYQLYFQRLFAWIIPLFIVFSPRLVLAKLPRLLYLIEAHIFHLAIEVKTSWGISIICHSFFLLPSLFESQWKFFLVLGIRRKELFGFQGFLLFYCFFPFWGDYSFFLLQTSSILVASATAVAASLVTYLQLDEVQSRLSWRKHVCNHWWSFWCSSELFTNWFFCKRFIFFHSLMWLDCGVQIVTLVILYFFFFSGEWESQAAKLTNDMILIQGFAIGLKMFFQLII